MTNRKAGRPRLFTEKFHLSLKMDGGLKKAMESYAEQHSKSKSEVIREALVFFLRAKGSHYNDEQGILRSRKL